MRRPIKNLALYPDGRAAKLREAVAKHHGLEPERLIFGNGSDEVFALLNQTYLTPGDNIVTGQYGFLAYRISALANQAEVKSAPEPKLKAEVDALLEQVDERTRIVYVSNPSNPTGVVERGRGDRAAARGPAVARCCWWWTRPMRSSSPSPTGPPPSRWRRTAPTSW